MAHENKKRPRDTNQLAKRIVDLATGEAEECDPTEHERRVKAAKQRGARARAESLTDAERSEIARLAADARWKKSD